MSIFYIADTHFGHDNIRRHSNRPFMSVDEMDKKMIKNWNHAVTNNDTVYILGDLCYGKDKDPDDYIKQLNGRKIMILGNHDKKIEKNMKNGKYPGLDKVVYYTEIRDTLNGQERMIVLTHYPMVEWSGFYHDSILLYGHIHNNVNNRANQIMKNIPNAYNVGTDILRYVPRTLEDVVEYNKKFNDQRFLT